jgi:UDP-2,3-diacylglucosamine pyrophosphatase LpxH
MKSIDPQLVILNGDVIDIWQFSKRYWPKSHMKVLRQLIKWLSKGVKVHYITGNHDEMLRKFSGFKMGGLSIVNKMVLELNNHKKAWIFHGDVFDVTMRYSKWLAKLGAIGYDTLILINRMVNFISQNIFKKGKLSLSKKIKNGVKSAVKFINQFELTAAEIGIQNGYDYVICGHIHHPDIREITLNGKEIMYLNSGDWIENLTALEYNQGAWTVYHYNQEHFVEETHTEADSCDLTNSELFDHLIQEFELLRN